MLIISTDCFNYACSSFMANRSGMLTYFTITGVALQQTMYTYMVIIHTYTYKLYATK